MPKRLVGFISRVFSGQKHPRAVLRVITRDRHHVSRQRISPAALKVLYRLKDAGYEAYLVGGGVRDLLLDGQPKDFDVATNATPEQVRRVFGNCRLIGRRFRLAHVLFGREVIEVATFRAGHQPEDPGDDDHIPEDSGNGVVGASGMILRDNVWGTIEQDALRRDFTVNALYYNIATFAIHDFVDGMRDLEHRTLRLIGDPQTRYREDPVRMLRAARFAAKLDFAVEEGTAQPIAKLKHLLLQVPAARLYDECLKLFMSGHGVASWTRLEQFGLDEILFAETARHIRADTRARAFVVAALESSDSRIADGKSVTPAFLFAALLWPQVVARFNQLLVQGVPDIPAMAQASQNVLDEQCRIVAIPRRFSVPAREIWDMQLRLPRRNGKRAEGLLANPRFRAAYDFLALRQQAGPLPGENTAIFDENLADWWDEYQQADMAGREELVRNLDSRGSAGGDGRKRRRRRKKT